MGAPYGSQCPEDNNSTDCLLRALLDLQAAQSSEYNWDPITFAFTTVIGAVALVFAITAIFQAVLASGKGRRRCSEKVLGKWSKKCKTGIRTWDWSEMNFQPTAVTPVLRAEYQMGWDTNYSCSLPQPQSRQGAPRFQFTSLKSSAASWLVFFEKLGLNEYSVEKWRDNKRSVAANYLPDDLVAAPAYAQVGAVVVATVMAGARKLDLDEQRYPTLFGPDFQIDFRQHPGLGVVGAYSQYGRFRDQVILFSLDLAARQYQFASSVVKYGPGFVDARFSDKKARPQQYIELWYNFNPQRTSPGVIPSFNYFSLEMAAVSEDHSPLLVGLLAATPKHVPMVFPSATMTIACHQYLTAFALNSWYFAHAPFDRTWLPTQNAFHWFEQFDGPNWEGFKWIDKQQMPLASLYLFDDTSDYIPEYLSKFMELPVSQPQNAPRSQNDVLAHTVPTPHRGYRVILNMCLKFIQEPEKLETWFFDRSPKVQDGLRELILKQLQEVDGWLRQKDQRAAPDLEPSVDTTACAIMLFNTTMILLRTENMLRDESSKGTDPILIPWGSRRSAGITTASKIHSNTLQVCKDLICSPRIDRNLALEDMISALKEEPRARHLVDVVQFEQGPRQWLLWDRLCVLVDIHEKDAPTWPSRVCEGVEKKARDFEDMVVYRCLLMILLFRTATDTTMMLPLMKSGIWNKIVPMI